MPAAAHLLPTPHALTLVALAWRLSTHRTKRLDRVRETAEQRAEEDLEEQRRLTESGDHLLPRVAPKGHARG